MDAGTAGEGRTVTILVPPGKSSCESDPPPALITTSEGMRVPAARWRDGRVEPLLEMPPERLDIFKAVIDKYMKDLLEGDTARGAAFYYNWADNNFQFSLFDSHPHGLVVRVFTRRATAEKIALGHAGEGKALETRKTNNLCELLTRTANEGYAGAILNDRDPIYFCLDADEIIHFLRLSQDEEEEIEDSLLMQNGKWNPLPEDGNLVLYVNQDSCDRTMVRLLGDIPFLIEEGNGSLSTVEDPERPGEPESFEMEGLETSAPGERMAVVFHGRRSTLEFMTGRGSGNPGTADFDVVAVMDIKKLLKAAERENLVVVLEPGGHRARSGVFWLNGEDVILDSFSGLWTLDEEKGFVHLP